MVRDLEPGLSPGPAARPGGRSRSSAARLAGPARTALRWLRAPLPPPPDSLRRGPLRPDAFPSALRSPRLTSLLGIALAVAFTVCFGTGLISHLIQHPPAWFWWPSRPVGLYRVTQGLHVATGLATVPLLGAKLWSVYPRLFGWPPARDLAHAAERASIAVLVAAALFQLVSGVLNIARWYEPMPFFFTAGHYWSAWLAVGALIAHIGVKLPTVRQALARQPDGPALDGPALDRSALDRSALDRPAAGELTRRGLLGTVGVAAGVITLATAGQTVAPLAPVSVLAPRRPQTGPQRLPVNRTAAGAGVRDAAFDPRYRLTVAGPVRTVHLGLPELAALPQHTVVLPISCVEGWSATGTWTGVRLRDLLGLVGVDPADAEAYVESLEVRGRYRATTVPPPHSRDPFTLIALRLGGEILHPDHGYPARLIAPNRPGVLQTKWVARITARRPE
ncbi:molybdopterin-dependent oxidoreductase [Jidongwangia harbinensis]|uniref:molybdopterin-dependent oxidoreductase n=1 Tax=Jidongwangia harbinensis TaxID=2878561 RepID=UPI001CD9EEDC|nr:molybdopterin-dependent oxidoreductase [Jidongwangia harbinensis]MCA2211507.1 molybdopterin-dependent oxidoreductase [Jidongwangia harbinensis]